MKSRNYNPEKLTSNIIFQVLDWYAVDENCEDLSEDEVYKIYLFGVTNTQHSISVRIDNYTPYFFVQIPEKWSKGDIKDFVAFIKRRMGYRSKYFVKYNVIKRKRYYGFENEKEYSFVRMVFSNSKAARSCVYYFKEPINIPGVGKCNLETYETNVDSVLRLGHLRDILMAGWIEIPVNKCFINYPKISNTEYDLNCDWRNLNPYECDKIADGIRTLYFDIECTSNDGKFPNADNPYDYIIQIGNIVTETGNSKSHKILFNLNSIDDIKDTETIAFDSEKELLLKWAEYIQKIDPDIICGYNIFGFDLSYLYLRAKKLGILEEFTKLTKLVDTYSTYSVKVMQSQQAGYNELKMLSTPGRLQIDLYQIIKREHRLASYKLDNVGLHFIGEQKDDVSPQDIFNFFKESAEKRKIIGEYCIQDVNLCVRLLNKLCILPNLVEMSKVTRVPITYLITRGQQIKAFSQIAYETRKNNFLIPTINTDNNDTKFKGATVLDAQRGAYFDKPVCGLDFASLYPSIMIAHNMCYSTIVLDPQYDNIDGIEYSTIEWSEENTEHKFRFVKNRNAILSNILAKLWASRKETKKLMNAEEDPFQKSVYNGKQLAIKISMNSVYGFTGACNGMLPCMPISSSVTACGRQMIDQTSRLAKERFNCEIVYGDTDSCYVIFPEDPTGPQDLSNLFVLADKAAKEISKTFIKPIELEFEKFMWPFLLFCKKRYIYLEWTKPTQHGGIEAKGVELVRRDNCPYVKETLTDVLDDVMYKRDIPAAVDKAQSYILNLLNDNVDINKLILSKTLSNSYKQHDKECSNRWLTDNRGNPIPQMLDGLIKRKKPTKANPEGEIAYEHNQTWCRCMKIPHLQLHYKIYDRDPNSAPSKGTRVPYIFVENREELLQCKKVEDPEYARANNLKPDALYYVEHQLKHPLETIFSILIPDTKVLFSNKVYLDNVELSKKQTKDCMLAKRKIEKARKDEEKRKADNIPQLTKYFKMS